MKIVSNKKILRQLESFQAELDRQKVAIEQIHNKTNEVLWGETFNSTICNSAWLLDKSFSPGRWAVGYPYLYILYRVLNEIKPKNILELGLGESTRMIAQYASSHNDAKHIVVEQENQWIDFFSNSNHLSKKTELIHLPAAERVFLEEERALIYEDFASTVGGSKYDFISIDGPGPSRSTLYARIDLLELIPNSISDSFCILFDDLDLEKCARTFRLVQEKFDDSGIDFSVGYYEGDKRVGIICSTDNKYLCSL